MKHATLLTSALVLSLGITALTGSAQSNQIGQPVNGSVAGINGTYLTIFGTTGPSCGVLNYRFTMTDPSAPWGSTYGTTANYYSLPAGRGQQSFNVAFTYASDNTATPNYDVFVDGQFCPSCTATVNSHSVSGIPGITDISIQDYITVTHQAGDAWSEPNNGVREFGLRYKFGTTPYADIRFKVIMVGAVLTDVLGYYDAPALPLYILRDPPGGASYSKLSQGNGACYGNTRSVTTGATEDGFFKARIGAEGSFGLGVEVEYEIFAEVGVSLSATQSETELFEYETCLETSSEVSTPNSGTPDDLFIMTAVRYAYGVGKVIDRPDCGTVNKTAYLATVPVQVNNSYTYTASYIHDLLIPQLEQDITLLPVGSVVRNQAEEQLSVWHQTLALNDSLKAAAPFVINRAFNGGNLGAEYAITRTTSVKRSIDYSVSLEAGLSFEFGVKIGGSGVSGGASVKMREEYGSGQNASNTNTNTMLYHLEDGDVYDNFNVRVGADDMYGTYTFTLDSANSRTSCRYEGGYQLDNPEISVGAPGQTSMTVNEAPIGTAVNFPLILCNNSDTTRTYYLKFAAVSNSQGAVMQAFGNTLNSNDLGIQLAIPGGACINTNLALTQPNIGVLDFPNINLYLYSECDEEYPPYIRSYITISAHYGAGNFGSYCTPVSQVGTAQGDYMDGVQLATINNTGTGGVAGPTYTDYSGQISTPLSRNAQHIITVAAGTHAGTTYAAWIDYNQNSTFEVSEKLGEATSVAAGEALNIAFTVPNTASLGGTALRVRGISPITGEPLPLDACFNYNTGETEDYAVLINANTPQDCAGVNNGSALPGTACDDGNAQTGNDAYNANCLCIGQPADCAGTPGGPALPGTACDDGNANTIDDVYSSLCQCLGIAYDCLGVPGGTAMPGTPCDDGNPGTGGDTYGAGCDCNGQIIDCAGVIGGTTLPGTPCNDGNPLSGGDVFNGSCVCAGQFATDCEGVEGGTAQPGAPCDDANTATGNDVYTPGCVCAGSPYDCAGTPGGGQLPGTPCDDNNPLSTDDTFTAECACIGTLAEDCAGVPGGTAQPGTPCDDDNADTGNDQYNPFCECLGQLIDCDGVAGGFALPGFPCDDGDATTGNDTLNVNCQCAGSLIDCLGQPGGPALTGTACDDDNPNTTGDTYNANCICAGVLANDCEGVAGGTAQPGTPCDDGDATTGNDLYSANCACAGDLIDCEGAIGGLALPGTACDDGVACTVNDVRGADCVCGGTALTIGDVTGATTVIGNTSNAFVITPIANATSYTWALPNGWTTTDNGAFVLLAQADNTPGPVELCVTAMVGDCELTSCITVTVDFNTGIANSDATSSGWFTVQPNPSNGIFSILPSDEGKEPVRLSVHDGIGRNVIAPFILTLERSFPLDMGNAAPGAYYLIATRGDRQQVVKLVVQR